MRCSPPSSCLALEGQEVSDDRESEHDKPFTAQLFVRPATIELFTPNSRRDAGQTSQLIVRPKTIELFTPSGRQDQAEAEQKGHGNVHAAQVQPLKAVAPF